MTLKRVARAFAVSLICLLASFLLITVILTVWYADAYPHDGQAGIGAVVGGIMVAPVFAVIGFVASLVRR